jgi:hypothetical protein
MRVNTVIFGVFIILCNGSLHAAYDADELKKLFTDKNQRARIDAARSGVTGADRQVNKIKLDGYVTRSSGKSVVWVNGQNTLDSNAIGNLRVHQPSKDRDKRVRVSIDGQTRPLKPGETWDKGTGKIIDAQ